MTTLSCTLKTRGCSVLVYVLQERLVDVVVLYLVIRTAFLTTEYLIGPCSVVTRRVGWYGLVRKWPGGNSTWGFMKRRGSHRCWSFRKVVAFQNPESVFTCSIFYAYLLAIWVNV